MVDGTWLPVPANGAFDGTVILREFVTGGGSLVLTSGADNLAGSALHRLFPYVAVGPLALPGRVPPPPPRPAHA